MQFATLTTLYHTKRFEELKVITIRADVVLVVEQRTDGESAIVALRSLTSCDHVQESVGNALTEIAAATKPVDVAWTDRPAYI